MSSKAQISDIEKILSTQSWKKKKLPSLQSQKRLIKLRSTTETEKLRKQDRVSTLPSETLDSDEEPSIAKVPFFTRAQGKKSLSNLAVPFEIINQALNTVSYKPYSMDLQVPLLPKRQFGKNSNEINSTPKFECVKLGFREDDIMRMKIESGRISQNSMRKKRKKFLFSYDFALITGKGS
jgi:hypothetical protein